jgi:phosphatidylglycerol phospholipase C
MHIGFDLAYARQFLQVPDVSFNLLQQTLVGPAGGRFLRDARAAGREVYIWTVNKPRMMRWGIRREVAGVLTDEVEVFLQLCREWKGDGEDEAWTVREALGIVGVNVLVMLFGAFFRWRYGFRNVKGKLA